MSTKTRSRDAWLAPWAGISVVLLVVAVVFAACGAGVPIDQQISAGAAGSAVSTADVVTPELTPKANLAVANEVNVSVAPNVPPRTTRTEQAIVEVHFEVVENVSTLDPVTGLEYETWGYRIPGDTEVSGTPGPMIRARVGDVLRFTITNPEGNVHPHNVDFHAVTGDHGGAGGTTVLPGETRTIEARLLYPGMFMYHCAHGDVPMHIVSGMYGGILVDTEEPLSPAEQEWYIVQSEFYLTDTEGRAQTDRRAVTDEHPTLVLFNGQVGAIAGDNALQMAVGERARIYFVNAGINLISSFHPIGSHWDRVYPEGALLSNPIRGSQTTLVPAGGGTIVEMIGQYPGMIVLVDHALGRAFDKGALGQISVVGPANQEIFSGDDRVNLETHVHPGTEGEATETTTPTEEVDGPVEDVAILVGSGDFQEMDHPDEFAENETPGDYSVNVLTIKAGTTVRWTNEDSMMHTVTDVDGTFDSGFMNEGDTWSYTFNEPGEFEYFCAPHPWMRAKVIVEP